VKSEKLIWEIVILQNKNRDTRYLFFQKKN